jgi:VWFA-related protein
MKRHIDDRSAGRKVDYSPMKHYSMKLRAFVLACALSALFVGIPGFSQSQPPKPPAENQEAQSPQKGPALRVLTRLVQVNVIAQDKNGQPVTGLKKEDFTLLDQGQEQKINFFAEQSNQALPVTAAVSAASAPAPNTFSNRFEQKVGTPTSVTVILLDTRNTHSQDMAYARKQVAKFLGQIQPQDRVALYSLSSKLYILHDFTEDATSLLQALDRDPNREDFRVGASEPEASDTGDAILDAAVNASNARIAQFYMNDRVEQTALAIKIIADHLQGLPGRKNLIWVSSAFPIDVLGGELPMDHVSYTTQIEDTARSLNNANVAIYPVDARGLIGNPQTFNRPGPRRGAGPNTASPFPARQNFDTMNTMAERTGGRAFYNTNDIQGAVRKAIDDSRVTYVLGYYPSNTNWDGKFRELKVRTSKPGVHLRYRVGYYALPDAPTTAAQKAQLLSDAEWSPLEATDLALEVQANPLTTSTARELQVQVRIAANQLHFEQAGNHWKDSLQVVWVEIGSTGKAIGTITKNVGFDVPPESYDLFISKGISFGETLKVRDDAIELRLVARDDGSGVIGSVNIPLTRMFRTTSAIAPPKN